MAFLLLGKPQFPMNLADQKSQLGIEGVTHVIVDAFIGLLPRSKAVRKKDSGKTFHNVIEDSP
jgi:hypothetical protein